MNRHDTARLAAWLAVALCAATCATAWAHHSFVMFDKSKVVRFQGIVRKVEWTNPHVYLFVDVRDAGGNVQEYAIECRSVNDLSHLGWKMSTIKVADHVTVGMYPLRDGKPGGLLESVVLPNGATLKQ
jgi:hypothetical protein